MNDLVKHELDGIHFSTRDSTDITFLHDYGKVIKVFDETDSGYISFGIADSQNRKYFIKVAGVRTKNMVGTPEEAVFTLRENQRIYQDLEHKSLIKLRKAASYKSLYYLLFDWQEGENLFDHWNFEYYKKNPKVLSPKQRFLRLPEDRKLTVAKELIDFVSFVLSKGYVPVDFYDGSLIYQFEERILKICDIDFFKKLPLINSQGNSHWGSKRMKAPEEYRSGASIDEKTAVFCIGALFFNIFSDYPNKVIKKMYDSNRFIAPPRNTWTLANDLYDVVLQAVEYLPENRYKNIADFQKAWDERRFI